MNTIHLCQSDKSECLWQKCLYIINVIALIYYSFYGNRLVAETCTMDPLQIKAGLNGNWYAIVFCKEMFFSVFTEGVCSVSTL